jgi:hypothetical protein
MSRTIMVIGLGGLGSVTLELLAREPSIERIVATARDPARGRAACNTATLGAMAQGCRPVIEFEPLDVRDVPTVARVVERIRPDIIFTSVTLQSWWRPYRLPAARREPLLRAGFGVWLPVHLALTIDLMRALRGTGWRGHVLTAPFPDVVNPVLARIELAPTCGVGNLDEIVPKVRLLAAHRLGCDPDAVAVQLVAHHALWREALGHARRRDGDAGGRALPPFHVRVEHAGTDVTEAVRARELLLEPFPVPAGPATHFLTAGSTVRLGRALLLEEETHLHVPGPGGLPGGYPVIVSRAGVRVAPVPGLTRDEAIAINEQSHRFDGVERIEPDGTVVFVDESADILAETLGYDCRRLPVADVPDRAEELLRKFGEFAVA